MKFCRNCGNEVSDVTKFCPNCGQKISGDFEKVDNDYREEYYGDRKRPSNKISIISQIAKAFMIVGCVSGACAFFIPLLWMLPMFMHYDKCLKQRKEVSTSFKICTLLFVNVVAGVLMLVDDDPYCENE